MVVNWESVAPKSHALSEAAAEYETLLCSAKRKPPVRVVFF